LPFLCIIGLPGARLLLIVGATLNRGLFGHY